MCVYILIYFIDLYCEWKWIANFLPNVVIPVKCNCEAKETQFHNLKQKSKWTVSNW